MQRLVQPEFAAALSKFLSVVDGVNAKAGSTASPDLLARELWYNRVNPFRQAWIADPEGNRIELMEMASNSKQAEALARLAGV